MKLETITTKLAITATKSSLVLRKHSPEIMLVVGITGVVASTVLACRATLKVQEVMDGHQDKMDQIHKCWDKIQNGEIDASEYTEKDKQKDTTVVYVQTAVDFIKLYGLPVAIGIASIGLIIGGHYVMKKRNVALMAAYKAIQDGFKAYRKRVVEEYGEDKDYELKNGLKSTTVTATEVGEDGKEHKVKKQMYEDADPNGISVYARFFDESCRQWSKNPEYNLMFLQGQQNAFNDILKSGHPVFLNEVYDALGIDRTKEGAIVGWIPDGDGDGYIDFGIFDANDERKRAFVNGYERSILLDFNVDGVIYDLL